MSKERWRRRIRGALGLGLTWGMAWFGAGMLLLLVVGPDAADVPFPLGFGMFGFLAGATFSVILGIAGRRRSFDQISLPRIAAWGAAGGLALCAGFVAVAALGGETTPLEHVGLLAPLFSAAGAASAGGSLALARRATEPASLEGGAEADRLSGRP